MESFGDRVRKTRRFKGLATNEVAAQTGISTTLLGKIEANQPFLMEVYAQRKLATALGVFLHWLLTGEGEMEPEDQRTHLSILYPSMLETATCPLIEASVLVQGGNAIKNAMKTTVQKHTITVDAAREDIFAVSCNSPRFLNTDLPTNCTLIIKLQTSVEPNQNIISLFNGKLVVGHYEKQGEAHFIRLSNEQRLPFWHEKQVVIGQVVGESFSV